MTKNGKITIRDIAKACGVTIATVSRAVNNQDGMRDEVRQHILRYIDSIGWRSNSLKNRFPIAENSGRTVLILCNLWSLNGGGVDSLQNTLALLIEKFEAEGIVPMVVYGQTLPVLQQCKTTKPYAVILLSGSAAFHEPIRELRESGIRVVAAYADRKCGEFCATVRSDNEEAATLGIGKFRKAGYEKTGIFTGLGLYEHPVADGKVMGALASDISETAVKLLSGFDPVRDVVGDCYNNPEELARVLKSKAHDSWIICGHSITQCFCRTAENLKIRIPEDLPVISFGPEQNLFDPLTRFGRFTSRSAEIAENLYELVMGQASPLPKEIVLSYRWNEGTIPLKRKRISSK